MTTVVLQTDPPKNGEFSLNIQRTLNIQIAGDEAQKAVARYITLNLSSQFSAHSPVLFVADHAYWRVPIHLTFPSQGDVGEVGSIDVDIESGELVITDKILEGIKSRADYLAERFTRVADR